MRKITLVIILWSLVSTISVLAQADSQIVLEPGVDLEGEVDPETLTADVYFDGVAGDVANFVVESGLNDGYIALKEAIVFLPDGAELARGSMFYFSQVNLPQYRLPQTGRYHIAIAAKMPGTFRVRYTIRTTPLLDDTYFYEETFYGSTAQYLDYAFIAQAGETIRARVETDWFDAVLTLYDPNGEVLATDDDSLGDLNPVIGPLTLERAGEYRLVVESYDPNERGKFYVYLSRNPTPPDNAIAYGQPLTVTLDEEHRTHHYWLEGSNGDVVNLLIDDPDAIAQVQLERSTDYGRIVVSTDDSVTRVYDNWHEFVLPAHERYKLVIAARDEASAGTVQVQLNLVGQNSLEGIPRELSVHVSAKNPIQRFYFMGYGNALARITITQDDYEADTMPFRVTVYDEAGTVLSQMVMDDMAGSFSLSNEFAVGLVTSPITLELEMLGEGPAWFHVSLEMAYGSG